MSWELNLATRHGTLAAKAWGPADGVKVLALHGWLDNAASFHRLGELLEGVRLVALDLPGHGRSAHRPAGCPYHFVDWIADVVAAADALGWQHFALLGHSMGAGIASLVPSVVPHRISRMVLVEGLGPQSSSPSEVVNGLREALRQESAGRRAVRVLPSFSAAVSARLAFSDLERDVAELLVERGTEAADGGVRFIHDPRLRLRSRLRFTEEQVVAFLKAIDCPVLAIRATAGWPFPEGLIAARMAAIEDLEPVEIEGGHHVHLTNPAPVAEAVQRFLSG